LHLYIHAGTWQKDFDGNFAWGCVLLGQEDGTRTAVTQQFLKQAAAYGFADEIISPGYRHAKTPLWPPLRRASKSI
jgi:hypothetical protein